MADGHKIMKIIISTYFSEKSISYAEAAWDYN